jgi:hypothetical protein
VSNNVWPFTRCRFISWWKFLISAGVMWMALGIATPWSAMADDAKPDAAAAQKHLMAGEAKGRAGSWSEALSEFELAHAAAPSGATAIRIAGAHYELGHKVEAYDAYKRALSDFGASLFGADKTQAEARLAELDAATGRLTIQIAEPGAAVSIDGRAVGTSPIAPERRVVAGEHAVKVSKPGYVDFDKRVEVAGGAVATVAVTLQKASTTGTIKVTEKEGRELRVLIDGLDVGPAPYEAQIAPGTHEVSGTSSRLSAPAQTVDVTAGQTAVVELVGDSRTAKLEIQITDGRGTVAIDGEVKGDGSWSGELPAGKHRVEVTLEGFETYEKELTLEAGDVLVESVTLRRTAAGEVAEEDRAGWSFDGLYGGLRLLGMMIPTGTGHSVETSCDSLGATSCEDQLPLGGGLAGYGGYAVDPLGIELYLALMADFAQATASFDGSQGSDINPLVASPARDEDFLFARVGGGAALRARALFAFGRFRVTGAGGVGFSVKRILLARDATAKNGATDGFAPTDVGYVSPALSFELAGQFLLAGTTALSLGLDSWIETAGDGVTTEPEGNRRLAKSGTIPSPIATPAYDAASGAQWYFGPFVGLQWGP